MAARGRRPGSPDTRDQVLDAARRQFAELGYPRATLRSIAREAGVDARLVTHYFGSKQQLFMATLDFPIDPASLVSDSLHEADHHGESLGVTLIRKILTRLEDPAAASTVTGLMRAAATEQAAADLVRAFISDRLIAPALEGFGLSAEPLRGGLVGSQIGGLILGRYVLGIEPLKQASIDELSQAIGPTVERYLTGDLSSPPQSPSRESQAPGTHPATPPSGDLH